MFFLALCSFTDDRIVYILETMTKRDWRCIDMDVGVVVVRRVSAVVGLGWIITNRVSTTGGDIARFHQCPS